jgi:hypothetical protein
LHAAVCAGVKSLASAGNFKAHVTVDGQHADGEVAAITIANAAPPTSVLAHGHTGDCIYDGEAGQHYECKNFSSLTQNAGPWGLDGTSVQFATAQELGC